MNRLLPWIVAGLLLLAACGPAPSTAPPSVTPATSSPTTAPTVDAGTSPCLTGDPPFVSSGLVAALGTGAGDAAVLSGVRWQAAEGCERVVMDFLTGSGAPASTLGAGGASVLAESGIVRILLPEAVSATAVADELFDGRLVRRAFVVHLPGGGLAVDLHLAPTTEVLARAFATPSPARVVVDLRPGEDRPVVIAPPLRSDEVLLLAPAAGPTLYPLQVVGFARPGVDALRVRLTSDGEVTFDRSVPVRSPGGAWDGFSLTIPDGPSGSVELFVGRLDAFEEPLDGVSVPLDLP